MSASPGPLPGPEMPVPNGGASQGKVSAATASGWWNQR